MAKRPGQTYEKSEQSSHICLNLHAPFDSIFLKAFDADERMVWIAPCEPMFDRDMKTIILTPKTMWAYDWIMRNFSTRLGQCTQWEIINPKTGCRAGCTPKHPEIVRHEIEAAMVKLDGLIQDSASARKPNKKGIPLLDITPCLEPLRSMGLTMLASLSPQPNQEVE